MHGWSSVDSITAKSPGHTVATNKNIKGEKERKGASAEGTTARKGLSIARKGAQVLRECKGNYRV